MLTTLNFLQGRGIPRLALWAVVCSLLIGLSSFQTLSSDPTWQLVKSQGDIDAYITLTDCDGQQVYLLKFHNNNQEEAVGFRYQIILDDPTVPDLRGEITLGPAEAAVGNCEEVLFQGLKMPYLPSKEDEATPFTLSIKTN